MKVKVFPIALLNCNWVTESISHAVHVFLCYAWVCEKQWSTQNTGNGEYTHLGPPGTGLAKRDKKKVGEGGKTKKTRVGSSYGIKETTPEGFSTHPESLEFILRASYLTFTYCRTRVNLVAGWGLSFIAYMKRYVLQLHIPLGKYSSGSGKKQSNPHNKTNKRNSEQTSWGK